MKKFFLFLFLSMTLQAETNEPNILYLEAEAYYDSAVNNYNDYDMAIEKLNLALEIEPEFAKAIALRGLVSMYKQDYETAINDLEMAISLDAKNAKYHSDLGTVKSYQGKSNEAINYYNKAIKLDDSDSVFYSLRGFENFILRKTTKALEDFNIALRLDPENKTALTNRGRQYYNLGLYNEALTDFEKIESIDPTSPLSPFFIGLISQENGDIDHAIEQYTISIERSSSFANPFKDPYLARSNAYLVKGYKEFAEKDAKKAEKLDFKLYLDIN